MITIGAVKYLGKQTRKPGCLVIGAFTDPKYYDTTNAATKWKSDTQECQARDDLGDYHTIF